MRDSGGQAKLIEEPALSERNINLIEDKGNIIYVEFILTLKRFSYLNSLLQLFHIKNY